MVLLELEVLMILLKQFLVPLVMTIQSLDKCLKHPFSATVKLMEATMEIQKLSARHSIFVLQMELEA